MPDGRKSMKNGLIMGYEAIIGIVNDVSRVAEHLKVEDRVIIYQSLRTVRTLSVTLEVIFLRQD